MDHVVRIVVRSAKLFALGLLCQGLRSQLYWPYVDLAMLRIMGVLQRIAIVYLVTALAYIFVPAFRLRRGRGAIGRTVQIILRHTPFWLVGLVCGAIYSAVLFAVVVPSREDMDGNMIVCDVKANLTLYCNAADYADSLVRRPLNPPPPSQKTAGGRAGTVLTDGGAPPSPSPGSAATAASQILGPAHMFQPEIPHEPEGFTTTASAIGSAFAGVFYGLVLRYFKSWNGRVAVWTLASIVLVAGGAALAVGAGVPINKKLYTTSYMLLTSGMVGAVLAVVYLLADVVGTVFKALFFPMMCVGMNAIIIYVGDSLLWQVARLVYYQEPEQNLTDQVRAALRSLFDEPNYGDLVWAGTVTIFWTLVAVFLWWRRIFFKV